MSIASEEANNLYSKPGERTIGRSCLFDFGDLRSYQRAAYQRGRTAEPTEAEIEAATTEWDRHGYFHREGTPIVCMCGARLADGHSYDAHLVHAMLIAARKAVTE